MNDTAAFPREDYQTDNAPGQTGMSLRDYFAAKAMQGIIGSGNLRASDGTTELAKRLAQSAYIYADAMLNERVKP